MADSNGKNGEEPEQFRKIFIGGLSLNTTDDGLRDFYGKYGTITDCVVMRDGATKKSRGFGFVTYSSKSEVDNAMANRPHCIDGKNVDPKRAVPRDQSTRGEANVSTQRLYVSGVREDHTEDHFKNYFSEFGNVIKVEVIIDKATGKPRGFGFVTFDDYDAVDRCVLAKSHMINGFRCDVKKALSREEMSRAQQSDRDRMERGNRTRGGRGGMMGGNWQGGRGGASSSGFREPHNNYGGSPGHWNQGGQYGYGAPVSSNPYASGNWQGNDWQQPQNDQWGGYGGSYQQSNNWGSGQSGQWNQGAGQWNHGGKGGRY